MGDHNGAVIPPNTNSHSTGYQDGEEEATQAYGLYVEELTTKPTQVAE